MAGTAPHETMAVRRSTAVLAQEMHTHTLLLVDDSSTTEHEVRSALAGEPIDLIVVTNGHAALDRIEDHRPDVVLASTTVPGVDGYGLANYVSQRSYLSNVAVLLLAADVTPSDTQRMKASGARGFITRPLEPGIVLANIKEVLIFPGPELREVDVLGQLTPAFDAIDASMTGDVPAARPHTTGHPITPEALERIVADAVRHAIAAYERARSAEPAIAREPAITIDRPVPAAPAQTAAETRLTEEMGINDFAFGEAPPNRVRETATPAPDDDFAFGIDDLPPVDSAPRSFPATRAGHQDDDRRKAHSSNANALKPLRGAVTSIGTAVAEQAGRLRSALGGRTKRREQPPQEPRED